MRDRVDPIPPPFGHIERPRVSRERSALLASDVAAPMLDWHDLDPEIRASTRAYCADQVRRSLAHARQALGFYVRSELAPPIAVVERVARLERSLAAVLRWP